jgi:hypothetical protein
MRQLWWSHSFASLIWIPNTISLRSVSMLTKIKIWNYIFFSIIYSIILWIRDMSKMKLFRVYPMIIYDDFQHINNIIFSQIFISRFLGLFHDETGFRVKVG